MADYEIWIKEGEVRKFGPLVDFGFAYRLKSPTVEREAAEAELRPGPALTALVNLLREIVSELPPGSSLTVVTDHDAYVGAFDARNWLAAWRNGRFKARPHWAAFIGTADTRGITLSVRSGDTSDGDRQILDALQVLVRSSWRLVKPPKPAKKDYKERGASDDLRKRALEKDEFPRVGSGGSDDDDEEPPF